MILTENNKCSMVLAGCFLLTSCFAAATTYADEQTYDYDTETPPAQSKGYSLVKEALKKDILLEAGYSYTHWFPEKISGAEMETRGLNLGWIELQSNTLNLFKNISETLKLNVSIPRLRYEFSNIEDYPENEVIHSHHETNEFYNYLVGIGKIDIPYTHLSIAFRYETERFVSKMTSQTDLYYVPESGDNYKKFQKGDTLYHETIFDDYAVVVQVSHTSSIDKKNGSIDLHDADLFIGPSYSKYEKPYSVDEEINRKLYNDVRTDYVFYSQLKGYGLFIERITPFDVEGPRLDFSFKIGYGDIELTDDYKLSEMTRSYSSSSHDYENIVYFNPKVTLGYRKFFSTFGENKNIVFDAFVSADYRDFDFNHSNDDDNINEDLIVKAYVSLGITF